MHYNYTHLYRVNGGILVGTVVNCPVNKIVDMMNYFGFECSSSHNNMYGSRTTIGLSSAKRRRFIDGDSSIRFRVPDTLRLQRYYGTNPVHIKSQQHAPA